MYEEEGDKPTLDKSIEKKAKELDEDKYDTLSKQIQAEWELAWDHQHNDIQESLLRLQLYNNQRRDKDAAGDTTMFTIFQTVFASLYVDRLDAEFAGREEGDEEQAENLTSMAKFDYDEMQKDMVDYDWVWDTLFFSRGILFMSEYYRDAKNKIYLPMPEVVDPTTFLRDPRAVDFNGTNRTRRNAARYFGREIRMSRHAMEKNPHFFDNISWKDLKFGVGVKDLIEDAKQARANALGYNASKFEEAKEAKLGDNSEYPLTEWYTHWKVKGSLKKCKVWLANARSVVVGFQELGDPDSDWKAVSRPLYPTSHDWRGTSIPDLTEDKQRHRAVAQNLGLKSLMADLYPNYIYDTNKVKNRNDLNFGFNKFIGVDGDPGAILPMRKAAPNMQLLDFIYNTLDVSAQKATATPEIQQGQASSDKRTLGEINIVASKVDTRYSLAAKVFGWSERQFWRLWYRSYKENFDKEVDEKIIRITGAFGPQWRPLSKKDMLTKTDPDVIVESSVVSRARQLEERVSLTNYFQLALQEPTSNRRYGLKKLARLYGMQKDEVDRLFPPTIDERQAEDENDLLNEGKFVRVFPHNDDNVHLEIHSKAKDTPATRAHIETHKRSLVEKKLNPELTAQDQGQTDFEPQGSTPRLAPTNNQNPEEQGLVSSQVSGGGQLPTL